MEWNPTVLDLVNFLAVLILSVAFHEMAHAWLADRFGDGTPREHGRMTLNPFAHIHPILTVALPAVFFWFSGGFLFMAMTPVNPRRMRNPRLHGMLTALGGPAASLLLGIACFVALVAAVAIVRSMAGEGPVPPERAQMVGIVGMAFQLNFIGAFFNLVPVPPLDGSSILEYFVPRGLRPAWEALRANAWMVFALLVASGLLGKALRPVMALTGDLAEIGVDLGRRIADGG